MSTIQERWEFLNENVSEAAQRAGRNVDEIEIMAVTKMKPAADVRSALDAGIRLLGENRVIEARDKYADVPDPYRLHLIGHLQRNKAKIVPGLFCSVESIDKVETASVLNTKCSERDTSMDILIEVNTSGENTKNGYGSSDQLFRDMEQFLAMEYLRPVGLMTIGPFTADEAAIRSSFASLRNLLETINQKFEIERFATLSMGMTSDYQLAILEGSTRIRVGSLLFGDRT